jgi:PDZ domain-containing protein
VSNRSTPQILAAVLIGVGILVGIALPVPFVVLSPGPVVNVLGASDDKSVIQITGAPTYPTTGQLDLTTVSESGGPHGRIPLTRVFGSWLDPTSAVVPTRLLYPESETSQQVEQQGTEEMLQSQDAAAVAALRHLGLPVTLFVSVGEITPGSPASRSLHTGERILAVDGTPVSTGSQVVALVRKHKPGDTVRFEVLRSGKPTQVDVVTVPSAEDPTVALVGFVPVDGYSSPVKVTIRLANVGGPSAGLMFTLGVVDKLTPQQENGGLHVAGTGTMDVDGNVGTIGGIRQKMAGARSDGATVFLVPAGNCSEALLGVPAGLRLVKVTTLDDALSGLADVVDGRPAPTCTR